MSLSRYKIFGRPLEQQPDGSFIAVAGRYVVSIKKALVVNGDGVGDGWSVLLDHPLFPIRFGLRATIELAIDAAEKSLVEYQQRIAEVFEG